MLMHFDGLDEMGTEKRGSSITNRIGKMSMISKIDNDYKLVLHIHHT